MLVADLKEHYLSLASNTQGAESKINYLNHGEKIGRAEDTARRDYQQIENQ